MSLSYDAFHVRAKEATLALALRLVHLLHHEIREGKLTFIGMTFKHYNQRQFWLHKADCLLLYFFDIMEYQIPQNCHSLLPISETTMYVASCTRRS